MSHALYNTLFRVRFALLFAVLAFGAANIGCTPFDYYDPTLEQPAPADTAIPSELAKVTLPAYRIEPPDVISIDIVKMVPLPPYRLETFDALAVNVLGTLLDQPINGVYLVNAEGSVDLGPAYGTVRVAGMTVDEAKKAIVNHLQQILKAPEVSCQLAQASAMQPISGNYLVAPDGNVNLRKYGLIRVAGMTVPEAKLAIEKHLTQFFDSPSVTVDVAGYNSKFYYIVTQGANQGDRIHRVPYTGNETVLDAICQTGGISQQSSTNIWIARPAPNGNQCAQVFPISWDEIVQDGATGTNYQIFPGDRVFIGEDRSIAASNFMRKVQAPFEAFFGFISLGSSAVRNLQNLGVRNGTSY